MRLVVRADLGGYAAALPGVAALADVEVERPFVLLCGPNGSGKTTLMQMIRATTGLAGPQQGRAVDEQFDRAARPEACGGDLAKLAAFKASFGKDAAPPERDWAGILDVRALGWAGQRTWLHDTRADTNLVAAGQFAEHGIMRQVGLIFGSRQASHGQMLRHGWIESLRWALGLSTPEDPYDAPGHLPPARLALREATFAEPRPAERWLFLDEPETAIDAEWLLAGLSVLVREAAVGRLRVFCASHSPLFAAGLGEQPSVQVLDMGGAHSWYALQKRCLQAAGDPALVARSASAVAGRLREEARQEAEAAAKAHAAKVAGAVRGMGKAAAEALLRAVDGERAETEAEARRLRNACHTLYGRGLSGRTLAEGRIPVTDLGREAAALLRKRAARPRKGGQADGEGAPAA